MRQNTNFCVNFAAGITIEKIFQKYNHVRQQARAGIGWASKKVLKEELTANPATNVMNYVKFTAVMAASIALKDYLEKQKILPD